jgi:hypothetical protein
MESLKLTLRAITVEDILSASEMSKKPARMLEEITRFIEKSSGLSYSIQGHNVSIKQSIDAKVFQFSLEQLSEVLERTDVDGRPFIQINFTTGYKVLFTDTLVGFKPRETYGLDMAKIPRVVTTPDLLSVLTAIEDGLSSETISEFEIEVLKRVYSAIIQGGESAGFDLGAEKTWLSRVLPSNLKASA